MSVIPSTNFPCTTSLPLVDHVTDPTYSKVKKIAIILFATILVIPLLTTIITLICDGIYNAVSCICPNVKTVKAQAPPSQAAPAPTPSPVQGHNAEPVVGSTKQTAPFVATPVAIDLSEDPVPPAVDTEAPSPASDESLVASPEQLTPPFVESPVTAQSENPVELLEEAAAPSPAPEVSLAQPASHVDLPATPTLVINPAELDDEQDLYGGASTLYDTLQAPAVDATATSSNSEIQQAAIIKNTTDRIHDIEQRNFPTNARLTPTPLHAALPAPILIPAPSPSTPRTPEENRLILSPMLTRNPQIRTGAVKQTPYNHLDERLVREFIRMCELQHHRHFRVLLEGQYTFISSPEIPTYLKLLDDEVTMGGERLKALEKRVSPLIRKSLSTNTFPSHAPRQRATIELVEEDDEKSESTKPSLSSVARPSVAPQRRLATPIAALTFNPYAVLEDDAAQTPAASPNASWLGSRSPLNPIVLTPISFLNVAASKQAHLAEKKKKTQ